MSYNPGIRTVTTMSPTTAGVRTGPRWPSAARTMATRRRQRHDFISW